MSLDGTSLPPAPQPSLSQCSPAAATLAAEVGTQLSASALPSNQQEGALYPADMAHLDQIPSLKGGLEDIGLHGISNPWNCGLGQANVLFECPFGGWLVIQGAPC